jgi:hypothetical protein
MATISKTGKSWYINFSRDGKHTRKSLGQVSEEIAKQALADFYLGIVPSARRDAISLTRGELFTLHRKSVERARERGIQHHLNLANVTAMYERSGGRCEVTGIEFSRYKPEGATRRPWYPSIDRIDSKGHYTMYNCRLVCVAVNIAMCEWGLDTLQRLSRALVLGNYAKSTPQHDSA